MKRAIAGLVCLTLAAACATGGDDAADPAPPPAAALPHWNYDSTMVFPADRSLARPEDGIALPDGRLIVADQAHGLRMVELDGTSRPFGHLEEAGYSHRPPAHNGGANGVSLEPDGSHVLVADVFGGAIYRVELSSGATEKVYQHAYGINSAIRDSKGAIWFTQSTRNSPEEGEPRLWAAIDKPLPDGALLRLGMVDGKPAGRAEVIVDSLRFANGVAIDEAGGRLYLSETMAERVLSYRVDLAAGRVSERAVLVDSTGADNLELDGEGHLWIAVPGSNEVMVVTLSNGARHTAFRALTPEQEQVAIEFHRRGEAGTSRMELMTPASWAPLSGPITGVIVGPGGGPVYFTGLGNALLKAAR